MYCSNREWLLKPWEELWKQMNHSGHPWKLAIASSWTQQEKPIGRNCAHGVTQLVWEVCMWARTEWGKPLWFLIILAFLISHLFFQLAIPIRYQSVKELGKFRLPFFGSTEVWTQGLMLARQVFYNLSHFLSPFCFSYFSDRVSNFCQGWPWFTILRCLPLRWDFRHEPPLPVCSLK
jgi:hypothetical protein